MPSAKNLRRIADRVLSGGGYMGVGTESPIETQDWKDWFQKVVSGGYARENMEQLANIARGLRSPEALNEAIGQFGFGGITQMSARALRELSERVIGETRQQGGTSVDPRTFRAPETGTMVGGRVPGTELSLPAGTTQPQDIERWIKESPVSMERDPWSYVGGWTETRGGKPYETFDIAERVSDPREAVLRAGERGERAVYDIGAGEELFTPPGEVIRGATHRSQQPLGILDVSMAGSPGGLRGEEVRRYKDYDAPLKGYMGVPGVYKGEPGLGPHMHTGDIGGIYDPSKDPAAFERIKARVQAEMDELESRDPGRAASILERVLIDEGYQGMVNPRSGIIARFQNVPLTYRGRIPGPYAGPRGRELDLFTGRPREEPLPPSSYRPRRLQRQQEIREDLFGSPSPSPLAPVLPAARKTGQRTTVQSPERKMYPGVYQDPRAVIEQARENWSPESPNLQSVFGVSRQDIDDAYRQMEQANPAGVRFAEVGPRATPYVSQIMGPANTQRVQNILELGQKDPAFAGSYGWYWNEPLYQDFVRLWGPDEGLKRYLRFHELGAGLSTRSAVAPEIQRATIADILHRQGQPEQFITGAGLPPGSGHVYQSDHAKAVQAMLERGTAFPTDPLIRPKTRAYLAGRVGANTLSPPMDAHFVRGVGLSDVRTMPDPTKWPASIGGREAGRVADWYTRQVVGPLGMGGTGAQALQWGLLGPQTGLRTKAGAPFMEILADVAAHAAKARGQTPREALDRYILGQQSLYEPGMPR